MVLYLIKKIPFLRNYYFSSRGRNYVLKKLESVIPHLNPAGNILDIGSGNGLITSILRERQFNVTPLDIHEGHYHPSVKPVVYDGVHIPFADKEFDTGLLLTILHHTEHPEKILREAARTCRNLIIIEDIYSNNLQKYYTFLLDRFVNLFYSPCPHTNKTDKQWKEVFDSIGLQIVQVYYRNIFMVKQAVYVLKTV